jgi:hypothetical protein
MKMVLWLIGLGVLVSVWIPPGGLIALGFCDPKVIVAGSVADETGPVGGAVVRVRATETSTSTGLDGQFVLQQN